MNVVSSASRRWLAYLIAGTCGIVLAAIHIVNQFSTPIVSIEPAVLIPSSTVPESEPFVGRFTILNSSQDTVLLKQLTTSCGCMHVRLDDGKELRGATELSIAIISGGKLPLVVEVNTAGRSGVNPYYITATLENKLTGDELTASGKIELKVQSGLTAEPNSVLFRARDPIQSRDVMLLDSYPDPGVEIESVSSSAPNLFKVELFPLVAQSETFFGLKPRYRLQVSLNPEELQTNESRSAYLTVAPKNESMKVLQIPVMLAVFKSGDVLHPKEIDLSDALPNDELDRVVWCPVSEDSKKAFHLLEAPKCVNIIVTDFGPNVLKILVHIRLPSDLSVVKDWCLKFGTGESNFEPISIPIRAGG